LAGAAVSPPGPQLIIAQMLGACGIHTNGSQHYVYMYCSASAVAAVLQCTLDFGTWIMVIYNFATWLHTLRNQRISDSPDFIRF
jgi:hypothetical protein